MILIFDTYSGLCNQILDIQASIHFALIHNYSFTFRNCSYRNEDIQTFHNKPFDNLFNTKSFKYFKEYIDYNTIENEINEKNTFNIKDKRCIELVKNENELNELIIQLNKNTIKYIVIKQFFSISNFTLHKNKFYNRIKPASHLYTIFLHLKKNILPNKYNFIHYRYEHDFTHFFKINHVVSIDSLIKNQKFKNKDLKVYIACSNLKSLSKTLYLTNDIYTYTDIIFKDDYLIENNLSHLNFEEMAFIDFLIGMNADEVIGHDKSSFSRLLNFYKHTKHYYNIF